LLVDPGAFFATERDTWLGGTLAVAVNTPNLLYGFP